MRFGVVILAAGASVRMGRQKLLLSWGNKTILMHLVDTWRELGATQIAAVIGPDSALKNHLGNVESIINANPESGMFSSVQCAARWEGWKAEVTHFVITLGDQPHVGIETLKAIINLSSENAEYVCQPARKGRGRHPVVLPRKFFLEVGMSAETNLKEFLRTRERRMFESDDAGLDVDVDTPEDYERALNIRRGGTGVPSS